MVSASASVVNLELLFSGQELIFLSSRTKCKYSNASLLMHSVDSDTSMDSVNFLGSESLIEQPF